MKKIALLSAFVFYAAPTAFASNLFLENDAIINEFKVELKQRLTAGMQEGGPANAIEVCAKQAPVITQQISTKYGVKLQRVSNKYRNPVNKPSAVQSEIIAYLTSNASTTDVYYKELDDNKSIYARPIKTDAVCLVCHGESLSDEVVNSLKQHYPNDLARGYKLGDIRGIFSLERTLDDAGRLGIKNFQVLNEDLWVGGKPTAEQLQTLDGLGVSKVINLLSLEEAGFDEAAAVKALGGQYSHIPISGANGVTWANSQKLRAELDSATGPVFVHCASSNRVGALLALDASANGASLEESLKVGRDSGMTSLAGRVVELVEKSSQNSKKK